MRLEFFRAEFQVNNTINISITMHFITFFVVSIVMCSFATSLTIISSDVAYPDNNIDNDITNDIVRLNDKQTNILETIYAKQSYGKSHRFYFTTGERVAGRHRIVFILMDVLNIYFSI